MPFSSRARLIHPLSLAICLSVSVGITATATIAQPKSTSAPLATTRSKKAMDWWVPGILGTSVAIVGVGTALFLRRTQQQPLPQIPEPIRYHPDPISPETGKAVEVSAPANKAANQATHVKTTHAKPATAKPATAKPATEEVKAPTKKTSQVHTEPTESLNAPRPTSAETIVPTVRMPRPSVMDSLVANLRSSDPEKRQKAIWELGQRGDSRAVQPLVDLLLDSDSQQRSLVLSSLSEISTRTLKPVSRALAMSMQDQNPDVRKNAIRDLTRVYDMLNHVSQLLQTACEDPDAEVQETAKWAIGQINRIKAPLMESSSGRAMSQPERLS